MRYSSIVLSVVVDFMLSMLPGFGHFLRTAMFRAGALPVFVLGRAVILFASICGLVQAEIIVDDFNVNGRVRNPAIEGLVGPYLEQLNHGPLGARRILGSRYQFFQVSGFVALDSNMTQSSALRGRLANPPVEPHYAEYGEMAVAYVSPDGGPRFSLSEGGINDTIFLDFNFFRGPGRLGGLFVRVATLTYLAEARLYSLPISEGPFTIAIPMSQMNGNGFLPPYRLDDIESMQFIFRSSGHPFTPPFPNYPWEFSLDRIRVGRLTPEPTQFGVVAALAIASFHWLNRRQFAVLRKK